MDIRQSILLDHFADSGDIYASRIHCGVSYTEFYNFLENPEFSKKYEQIKSNILSLMNDEKRFQSEKYIQNILIDGCVRSRKIKVDGDGVSTEEVTESYIPHKYLEVGGNKGSVENAISVLLSEGLIPEIIARKIIAQVSDSQNKIKNIFDDGKSEKVSDTRVMGLIQKALGLERKQLSE